jgi:glycosyltransferase involved in cell wall biosynthesis
MRVSFIIPALNEERHIPSCLRSIADLERPAGIEAVEVIVVDNMSRDRTVELARSAGAVIVTEPPGRISRSRNAGARTATGDLLAFIDADCELPRDWLVRCVGHLMADAAVLAVGTGMAPPSADAPWVETVWYALAHGRPAEPIERVEWLATYNLLVRRSAFEAVGGFDESLITCEDSDLGYKLSARGRLLRDCTIRTVHHGESKTLKQFVRREAWRSRGNLRSFFGRKLVLSELPSLLVPPLFVLTLVAGLILIVARLATGWAFLGLAGSVLLLLALLLPILQLLRKGITPLRPWLFVRAWLLVSVYYWARAVGLVIPLDRVNR